MSLIQECSNKGLHKFVFIPALNFGHYTSYARHMIHNEWAYYNDETVTAVSQLTEVIKGAYPLSFVFHRVPPQRKTLEVCTYCSIGKKVQHKMYIYCTLWGDIKGAACSILGFI